MMKNTVLPLTALLLCAAAAPAFAGRKHYHRHHHHGHYHRRPHVHIYSSPYYYAPPAVVYQPRTVYVERPVYVEQPVRAVRVEENVQAALAKRGYYGGVIDGQIGPQTRASIRAYQVDKGLPVTGRIDGNLLRSLRLL